MVCLDEKYSNQEMDIKLLYVGMTRPMHRLTLYGNEPTNFLLDQINETDLYSMN
jgi:DNA helicase-2/ATP-dependent DNA helicase PcrA